MDASRSKRLERVPLTSGHALFIAKLRYRIPVLPCVFLLAGVAAVAAWRLASRRDDGAGRLR